MQPKNSFSNKTKFHQNLKIQNLEKIIKSNFKNTKNNNSFILGNRIRGFTVIIYQYDH